MKDEPEIIEIKDYQKTKKNNSIIDLVNESPTQAKPSSSKVGSQVIKIEKHPVKSEMMIEDLYERMLRFCILCRINHISHFKTKKGIACTKMMIVDDKGDEVLCMLFDKSDPDSSEKPPLLKGRVYYF